MEKDNPTVRFHRSAEKPPREGDRSVLSADAPESFFFFLSFFLSFFFLSFFLSFLTDEEDRMWSCLVPKPLTLHVKSCSTLAKRLLLFLVL